MDNASTYIEVFKCFAEAKKVSDDLCPGLEAKTIMLNCPNWFWMMWRLCPAKTKAKDKIGICPVHSALFISTVFLVFLLRKQLWIFAAFFAQLKNNS